MPLFGKKALQEFSAAFGLEPPAVGEWRTEAGVFGEIDHRTTGAGLGVCRGPHNQLQPCLPAHRRAHRAWFQGRVQSAVLEPPTTHDTTGRAQGQQFGVAGWVIELDAAVPGTGDDLTVLHDNGPDRNFATTSGGLCLVECFGHEPAVYVVEYPIGKHVASITKGPVNGAL